MRVVGGDWPADGVVILKRSILGRPVGLVISKSVFATDEILAEQIATLEIVTDPATLANDDRLRQTASLFLASKEAKQNHSLVFLKTTGERRALISAESSEVSLLVALHSNEARSEKPRKDKKKNSAAGCGCIVIIVLILIGIASNSSRTTSGPADRNATTVPASDPVYGHPTAAAQAAFLATHNAFMSQVGQCDRAWDYMTAAMNTGDVYQSYDAAKRGEETCRDISMSLNEVRFDDKIDSTSRDKLNNAIDECSVAMTGRQTALEQAATIFNGNVRPSDVDEFKQRAQFAQMASLQCMLHYIAAANDGKYQIPDPGDAAARPSRRPSTSTTP